MYEITLSETVEIMYQNQNSQEGEFDLGELLAALWSHKFFISFITVVSILLAGFYVTNSEKKFTASAIFKIEEKGVNSGFSFPKEMGALASLTGLSTASSSSNLESLIERVNAREFILNYSNKYSMYLDPYFNTYNPDYKDPFWKATLKQIIGWQRTQVEKNAIAEHTVARNFQNNIALNKAKSGTITILVTHTDPKAAANYANNVMKEIKLLVETESDLNQKLQMNYLSGTLADALQDMEKAQQDLNNYSLKNSALAQEIFITDSLKLDELRMEKRKVMEITNLLSIIESLVKTGNLDDSSYEALQSNHPLIDDIDFRRILGMSETISSWTWPKLETIKSVVTTLKDRTKRIDIDIKNIEQNAKIYATSAEDLAQLKREAKIAEATYILLIEQVKSQSLMAGFRPETFKVFEYATKPLVPSSPDLKMVLVLSLFLGMFTGCVIALINSKRKGVYNSRSSLIFDANAELALKSKPFKRISRRSISDIISFASKHRITALDEATLKLSAKKVIYIINYEGGPFASDIARLLATQSAKSGRSVVLCDTTEFSKENSTANSSKVESEFSLTEVDENINIMTSKKVSNFFTSKKFYSSLNDLIKSFDQVFVCCGKSDAQLGLMALMEFDPALVLIARLRKTKKIDIKNLKAKKPIDLLLYE